jgi:hypothetical protein
VTGQAWQRPRPRAVTCAGGGTWFSSHDYWSFPGGRWHLDHPVCLVFTSAAGGPPASVETVEAALHDLGFSSLVHRLVVWLGRAAQGGLAVGDGEPRDVRRVVSVTAGVKRPLHPGTLQSSLHVRIYEPPLPAVAPPSSGLDRAAGTGPSVAPHTDPQPRTCVVGSAHADVNELMRGDGSRLRRGATLPRGAPDPGLGATYLKYGGNSEWAEQRLADLWEAKFGSTHVARNAVPLSDPIDHFEVEQQGTQRGHIWVTGKWWRSDGRATVLTLPPQ